jgi:ferritin-like metal-binding protein YciE
VNEKETLIAWLNDAHAMEVQLQKVLESQITHAEGHNDVRAKLEEHLDQTKHHAELVEQCVNQLGGSTSALKSGMSNVMGMVQGMSTGTAKDTMIKDALAAYGSESFEIACYTALLEAANMVGESQVANVCRQILNDETKMKEWLEQNLPTVVRMEMTQMVTA